MSHCGRSAADAYCPHTYLYTGRWDFPSKSLSLTSLSPRLLAIFCASSSDVIDTLAPSTPCSVILSLLTPATPLAAADSTLLVFLGRCVPEWSAKKRLVITFGPRTLRHSWPVLRIPFIAAAVLLRRNQVGSRNSHFVQYSMCVGSSSNPSKPKTFSIVSVKSIERAAVKLPAPYGPEREGEQPGCPISIGPAVCWCGCLAACLQTGSNYQLPVAYAF